MKIFDREIKISIEKCPTCSKRRLVIEIKTKKWFKGREYIFQDFVFEKNEQGIKNNDM